MGVDFGAILFYGFEAETDEESMYLDITKDISDLADELYYVKGETVQFQSANRGWSSEWFIVQKESYQAAYNGEHIEFDFPLENIVRWNEELKDFTKRYGYYYGEPKWHLISTIE
jgi:hypothetical protein